MTEPHGRIHWPSLLWRAALLVLGTLTVVIALVLASFVPIVGTLASFLVFAAILTMP